MGKIFLSGGGNKEQTRKLDEQFARLVDGKKMMYIPLALERDGIGFEACFDWIVEVFSQFKYEIEMPQIEMFLDPKAIKKQIENYDAIYIGGGNTFKLLQILYEGGIIPKIHEFLANDKIIYGGSAGAIIFGKSIETVAEENDQNYQYVDGLDLLGGNSLVCHFEGGELEKGVIGLKENEGLIVDNGEIFYVV